jgi:hypothetical protein
MQFHDARSWKAAIRTALDRQGKSRYRFIRECADRGICSVNTGDALLAESGSTQSDRVPNLETALAMAREAGLVVTIEPKAERKARRG